jgi:Zn-dependent peptidase ImmA (M78 family)
MTRSPTLGRQALRAALETRAQLKLDRASPACPFDAADRLGIEVKFRDEGSMDGMYVRSARPAILVTTHRSPGRRSLTCAHELGHHVFGHGTSVDEVLDENVADDARSPAEQLANLFAGYFLMPKALVEAALRARRLDPAALTAVGAFRLASYLGVSFGGLLNHMRWSLEILSAGQLKTLLRAEPKQLKAELASGTLCPNVWPVDQAWIGRSVDAEVGDLIIGPPGVRHEGMSISDVESAVNESRFVAMRPGISRLSKGGWNVFVRVQRAGFVGRSIFRHDEDPDAA